MAKFPTVLQSGCPWVIRCGSAPRALGCKQKLRIHAECQKDAFSIGRNLALGRSNKCLVQAEGGGCYLEACVIKAQK